MKKLLSAIICLLTLGVSAQNQQNIGAANTQLHIKGFASIDSLIGLKKIDTATARMSYSGVNGSYALIGFASRHPYIWTGSNWLSLNDSADISDLIITTEGLKDSVLAIRTSVLNQQPYIDTAYQYQIVSAAFDSTTGDLQLWTRNTGVPPAPQRYAYMSVNTFTDLETAATGSTPIFFLVLSDETNNNEPTTYYYINNKIYWIPSQQTN